MARLSGRQDRLPFLHLLPSLVTIIGLCAGLTSIRYVFAERFELAAGLIIFAAVIDGLDGLLARRLNATSTFGAELDSLSDFVNFGVAPGLLVYQLSLHALPGVGWITVLVYAICCCLRLARFNVNRDVPLVVGKAHFVGVPAPAGALLAMLPVFLSLEGIVDTSQAPWAVSLYVAVIGLLMVSRLQTFSPKSLRISRDVAAAILIGAAILVGVMFTRFWLLMVLLMVFYLAGLAYSVFKERRSARKYLRKDDQ